MNTTGRWSGGMCSDSAYAASKSAGMRRFSSPISLSMAPVDPEPQKITATSSPAPSPRRTIRRASSRSLVVCRPVPLDSVCVLA